MAQNQITVDSEILYHLFLKDSQDDGVAKLLESVLTKFCRLRSQSNWRRNLTRLLGALKTKNAQNRVVGYDTIREAISDAQTAF